MPGSAVTMLPAGSGASPRGEATGASWISSPYTVAEAVAEGITVACRLDNLTACCVNVPTGHTGLAGSNACKLRVQHGVVDETHFIGHMIDRDRARHVRAVAVIDAAEVHRHEIARLDGLFHPVRHAAWSCSHPKQRSGQTTCFPRRSAA